jgi:hypothetical protein
MKTALSVLCTLGGGSHCYSHCCLGFFHVSMTEGKCGLVIGQFHGRCSVKRTVYQYTKTTNHEAAFPLGHGNMENPQTVVEYKKELCRESLPGYRRALRKEQRFQTRTKGNLQNMMNTIRACHWPGVLGDIDLEPMVCTSCSSHDRGQKAQSAESTTQCGDAGLAKPIWNSTLDS